MDHVAILKDGPLDEILCGKKTIESRWSVHRRAPFDAVKNGDTIFLKRTGGPVEACASVVDVKQFSDLTLDVVHSIVATFGKGLRLTKMNYMEWWNPKKKYCCLIFLDRVQRIAPFDIDKTGFGTMAAWLVLRKGIESVIQKP